MHDECVLDCTTRANNMQNINETEKQDCKSKP